jgi:hypothetical protein
MDVGGEFEGSGSDNDEGSEGIIIQTIPVLTESALATWTIQDSE